MQRYVVGVVFDEKMQYVLLIRKKRPAFMDGKLNVVGGHIEEESDVYGVEWHEFLRLKRPNKEMIGFWAVGNIWGALGRTDEEPQIHNIASIPVLYMEGKMVMDTAWLIMMAHEAAMRGTSYYVRDTTEGADAWSTLE
jgi:hypothetical protein